MQSCIKPARVFLCTHLLMNSNWCCLLLNYYYIYIQLSCKRKKRESKAMTMKIKYKKKQENFTKWHINSSPFRYTTCRHPWPVSAIYSSYLWLADVKRESAHYMYLLYSEGFLRVGNLPLLSMAFINGLLNWNREVATVI